MRTPTVAMRLVNAYIAGLRQRLPNFVLSYLDKVPCGSAEHIIELAELYPRISPELLFLFERFDGTVWQPPSATQPHVTASAAGALSSPPPHPVELHPSRAGTTAKNLLKSAFIGNRAGVTRGKPSPNFARLRHGGGLPVLGSALDACPYVLLPIAQLIQQGKRPVHNMSSHNARTESNSHMKSMQASAAAVSATAPSSPHLEAYTQHRAQQKTRPHLSCSENRAMKDGCGYSNKDSSTTSMEEESSAASSSSLLSSSSAAESSSGYTHPSLSHDIPHHLHSSQSTPPDGVHTRATGTSCTSARDINDTTKDCDAQHSSAPSDMTNASLHGHTLYAPSSPTCKTWVCAQSVAALYTNDGVTITRQWPPAALPSLPHSDNTSDPSHQNACSSATAESEISTSAETSASEIVTERSQHSMTHDQSSQARPGRTESSRNECMRHDTAVDGVCDAAAETGTHSVAAQTDALASAPLHERAVAAAHKHHHLTSPRTSDADKSGGGAHDSRTSATRREHSGFSWSRVAAAVVSGVLGRTAASRYRSGVHHSSSSSSSARLSRDTTAPSPALPAYPHTAAVFVDPRIDIHAGFGARLVFAESLHFHQHAHCSSLRGCGGGHARDGTPHVMCGVETASVSSSTASASQTHPSSHPARHNTPHDKTLKTAMSWLFLDFEPDVHAGGKVGQVVQYMHNPDSFIVIADDFGAYLKHIMSNEYRFTEELEESDEESVDERATRHNANDAEARVQRPKIE